MSETVKEIIKRHLESVPVKLGALASDLGIEVFRSPLKPGISGLIEPSKTSASGFRIKLNRHESVERQRFTLAHEIAHFLLHKELIRGGVVDNTMYRSNLSSRHEIEANKLASLIIMPDAAVERLSAQYATLPTEEKVARMAKQLRVSEPAMRIKLGV
ncbi:ImmA/IrrE family metallo-endopeptidase [Pseudopontixanthobacter vadosimaris]|uniref:ImmA/IrrE family metallo-endopeptidase n=1 Tax=Pseudopontixanthobacter vadosimaris TaxID=2726450 RepID=UPI0014732B04|nr:ImmA/IrrE family metallo-endopeptidase [Pseudopontixanthobacter vadosimaris]